MATEISDRDVLDIDPVQLAARGSYGIATGLRGEASRFEGAIKQRWPKEPHWYLAILSVSPESQGKGHGGALLRPGLERADAEGLPAYLETQRERNLGFYERHGFELVEKLMIDGELPVWLMYRPAK